MLYAEKRLLIIDTSLVACFDLESVLACTLWIYSCNVSFLWVAISLGRGPTLVWSSSCIWCTFLSEYSSLWIASSSCHLLFSSRFCSFFVFSTTWFSASCHESLLCFFFSFHWGFWWWFCFCTGGTSWQYPSPILSFENYEWGCMGSMIPSWHFTIGSFPLYSICCMIWNPFPYSSIGTTTSRVAALIPPHPCIAS